MMPTLLKFSWRCAVLAMFCTAPAIAATPGQPQTVPAGKVQPQAGSTGPVEEAMNETPRRRGINNDAGVPPSGVPTETMHA